jgi:hypothetical protein
VSDPLVLLGDAAKELLNSSLLVVGVIAVLHNLLQQSVEAESKVINVLTWLEGQILPLLAKCLQCGLAGAIATDACRSDGVPGQASLVVRFFESENCILGRTVAMRASSARRSSS